jgi:hypothetical protein
MELLRQLCGWTAEGPDEATLRGWSRPVRVGPLQSGIFGAPRKQIMRKVELWRQMYGSCYAHGVSSPSPAMRYSICLPFATLLLGCNRPDRDLQVAECVDIYRTAYVTGQVTECLIKRYGWSPEDAKEAEQKSVKVHPDSAASADSGQIGDSLRK